MVLLNLLLLVSNSMASCDQSSSYYEDAADQWYQAHLDRNGIISERVAVVRASSELTPRFT
jgi:hypothetical protein